MQRGVYLFRGLQRVPIEDLILCRFDESCSAQQLDHHGVSGRRGGRVSVHCLRRQTPRPDVVRPCDDAIQGSAGWIPVRQRAQRVSRGSGRRKCAAEREPVEVEKVARACRSCARSRSLPCYRRVATCVLAVLSRRACEPASSLIFVWRRSGRASRYDTVGDRVRVWFGPTGCALAAKDAPLFPPFPSAPFGLNR